MLQRHSDSHQNTAKIWQNLYQFFDPKHPYFMCFFGLFQHKWNETGRILAASNLIESLIIV